MGIVGRIDQYASMLTNEFDDYSMSENLLIRSEQFNNNDWAKANTTVSNNASIGPDGTLSADNVSNTPNVASYISQGKTLVNSTTYTFSLYVKPLTANKFLAVEWGNPGTTYSVGNFDLSTLSFSGQGSGTITEFNSGWYRISHTVTTSATGTVTFNVIYLGAYGTTAASVTFAFWGAQLERSTVATDYTQTITAAVSRVLPTTTNINITGLSTYFAAGFSENVGIGSTLSANVFPPYDLVYDDFVFGGTLFGPGQGRYKRQNIDKSVVVYNEIDEVTDFRDIVRTGLVLDLDAGQALSYKTTGTTWNDLSGIGNTTTLINGPTFTSVNGGAIVFDGVDDNAQSIGNVPSFKFTGDFSVDGWMRPSVVNVGPYVIFDTRISGSSPTGIVIRIVSNNLRLYNGLTNYLTSSVLVSADSWFYFCISRIGSTTTMYTYTSIGSGSVSTTLLPTSLTDGSSYIGRTNESVTNLFVGRMASLRVYNGKGLTATEVVRNYDASRHRFGL